MTPWHERLGRGGFTLLEALIVVVLMGILLALVAPRVRDAAVAGDVRSARAAVANLYARARVSAVQLRRPATLQFNGNLAYVTVTQGGGLDTVGAVVDLMDQYGVTLTPSGNVRVTPTGLVNASPPITIMVYKTGKTDSLKITGYGRIQ